MEDRKTVNEFVTLYNAGKFDSPDMDTQIEAGWYDWFCKDSSLVRRLKPLANMVKAIAKSDRFDASKSYVFFKNNCPMVGSTYDSFSICDIETGDVLFWIGFLKKGCHGIDYSRIEVACRDRKEGAPGSFGDAYEFETRKQVRKFFDGLSYDTVMAETISEAFEKKEKELNRQMEDIVRKRGENRAVIDELEKDLKLRRLHEQSLTRRYEALRVEQRQLFTGSK